MQMHPIIGEDILKDFISFDNIEEIVRYHHERYDAQGYCKGIKEIRFNNMRESLLFMMFLMQCLVVIVTVKRYL